MRIVKQMIISNQTRRLRTGNCRMPWDIFNEVAVMMVGKVRAEKAGWKPCFKILGKRLRTKKKKVCDARIITSKIQLGRLYPPTLTKAAKRRENGAQ